MKKYLVFVIILLRSFNLFSIDNDSLEVNYLTSSINTKVNNPAESSADDDTSSYWSVEGIYGWIDIELANESFIYGICIDSNIEPESRYVVYFEAGDKYIPFAEGQLKDGIYRNEFIDLSYDAVTTGKIRISVYGVNASSSKLYEIKVFGRNSREISHKLKVAEIESDDWSMWYTQEDNLIDNNTMTKWYSSSFNNWSHGGLRNFTSRSKGKSYKDWLDFSSDINDFKRDFGRHGRSHVRSKNIFHLEENSFLEKVSIFIAENNFDNIGLEAKVGDQWEEFASYSSNEEIGWVDFIVPDYCSDVDMVRMTTDGYERKIGGISEVSFWGRNLYSVKDYIISDELFQDDVRFNNNEQFSLNSEFDYQLEILTASKTEINNIQINGRDIRPDYQDDKMHVFTLDKKTLFEGDNFLHIEGIGELSSYRIYKSNSIGRFSIVNPDSSLFDGRFFNNTIGKIVEQEFGEPIYLQKINLYSIYDLPVKVSVFKDGSWFELPNYSNNNFYRSYDYYGLANKIKLESEIELPGEVELIAYRIGDRAPQISLDWPEGYTNIDELSRRRGCVIGFVDNTEASVTVNGIDAQVEGHNFWLPISALDTPENGIYSITAIATDNHGRSSTDTMVFYIGEWYHYMIYPFEDITYTKNSTTFFHGWLSRRKYTLECNGQNIPLSWKGFFKTVELEEGFNLVKFNIRNRRSGEIAGYIEKKVVRYSDGILVKFHSFQDGSLTNKSKVDIAGSVKGAGNVSLQINGKPQPIINGQFGTSVELVNEGLNEISIYAEDEVGNIYNKTIRIFRDTIAPEIKVKSPMEGNNYKSSSIYINGYIQEESQFYVFVNDHSALINGNEFSYSKTCPDGANTITVTAKDIAGNISEHDVAFFVDSTGPEAFTISANTNDWTNMEPVLTFAATDNGTGISHYEAAIENGDFTEVTSPYQLPELDDGEYNVFIRAVDILGNTRTEVTRIKIDKTVPDMAGYFNSIPGEYRILHEWDDFDSDVVSYLLEREPEFEEGIKSITNKGYIDSDIENGTSYVYRLSGVDRAGNIGIVYEGYPVLANQIIEPVNRDEGDSSVIEFEAVTIDIRKETIDPVVESIKIEIVESEELEALSPAIPVSPIYDFSVITSEGEELTHTDFTEKFTGSIWYDESEIPENCLESDLKIYYFDETFGFWAQTDDIVVDAENNTIEFKSDHFSNFQAKASSRVDLTPEDLKDIGYSPLKTSYSHGDISVSTLNGALSTSVSEFSLPGELGFDFSLTRRYSSNLSYELQEDEDDKTIDQKIAEAHSLGRGWYFDIPYLRKGVKSIEIALPGGGIYPLNNFTAISTEDEDSESHDDFTTVYLEHHDSSIDVGVELVLEMKTVSFSTNSNGLKAKHFNSIYSLALILKDGTRYDFHTNGLLNTITSPQGIDTITYNYANTDENSLEPLKLDNITDSKGRVLRFAYNESGSNINQIILNKSAASDEVIKKITYSYNSDLLASASYFSNETDNITYEYTYGSVSKEATFEIPDASHGTKWSCSRGTYDEHVINRGPDREVFKKCESCKYTPYDNRFKIESFSMSPLVGITGLGKGILSIKYNWKDNDISSANLSYTHSCTEDNYGKTQIEPQVSAVVESVDGVNNLKTVSYEYGDDNLVVTKTDGKIKTIYTNEEYSYIPTIWRIKDKWFKKDEIYNKDDDEEEGTHNTRVVYYENSSPTDTGYTSLVKTEIKSYDSKDRLNLLKINLSDSGIKTSTYLYDSWGNVVLSREEQEINGRERKVETFNVTPCIFDDDGKIDLIFTGFENCKTAYDPNKLGISSASSYNNILTSYVLNYYKDPDDTWDFNKLIKKMDYNSDNQIISLTEYEDGAAVEDSTGYITTYKYYETDDFKNKYLESTTKGTFSTTYSYSETAGENYSIISTIGCIENADGDELDSIETIQTFNLSDGTVKQTTDGNGNITYSEYDWLGRITKKEIYSTAPATDAFPVKESTETISYTQTGNQIKSVYTNALGAKAEFLYNFKGDLISIIKKNRAIVYTKDETEPVELAAESTLNTATIAYNPFGNSTSISMNDPNSNNVYSTSFGYDNFGKQNSITNTLDSVEIESTSTFDYTNNILENTDANGSIVREIYDFDNLLISRTVEMGTGDLTEEYWYDGLGQLRKVIDRNNNTVTKTYTDRGLEKEVIQPSDTYTITGVSTKNVTPVISNSYNEIGQVDETIVSYKIATAELVSVLKTIYLYDTAGRVIKKTTGKWATIPEDGNYREEKYEYDGNGNLIKQTDPESNVFVFTYGFNNNVLTETNTFGTESTTISTKAYDALGQLISETDANGYITNYYYNDANQLRFAEYPSITEGGEKCILEYQYDYAGNVVSKIEPGNIKTTYIHDDLFRVTRETINSNNSNSTDYTSIIKKYKYDNIGNVLQNQDSTGMALVTYTYDELNQMRTVSNPDGGVFRYGYDGNGNKAFVLDARGKRTDYTYSSSNLLTRETDPKGNSIENEYDILGNKKYYKDKNNLEYLYTYNIFGNLLTEKAPRYNKENLVFTYDKVGNVITIVNANNIKQVYDYGISYQLDSIEYQSLNDEDLYETVISDSFTYDIGGNLLQAVSGGVIVRNNYSETDNSFSSYPYGLILKQDTLIDGQTFTQSYSYDEALRLNSQIMASGNSIEYGFNGIGMLNSITGKIGSTETAITEENSFSYSSLGQLEAYGYGNGTDVNINYDGNSRLDNLLYSRNSNTGTIKEYSFAYDYNSNIVQKDNGLWDMPNVYEYDSMNQLAFSSEWGRFRITDRERGELESEGKFQRTGQIVSENLEGDGIMSGNDVAGQNSLIFNDQLVSKFGTDDLDLMLDYNATSIGIDLGASYCIQKIEIETNNEAHRLNMNTIEVFYSATNIQGSYAKIPKSYYQLETEGSIINIRFKAEIEGKYIKVHSYHDDRNTDDNPVVTDVSVFNPVVFVYYSDKQRRDTYTYDNNGNRATRETGYGGYGRTDTYRYYPNSDLLMTDGKLGYIYDNLGNLEEKGLLISSGNNSVVLNRATKEYKKFTYNAKNQLERVETFDSETEALKVAQYNYDYRGYRIKEIKDIGTRFYVFNSTGQCVSEYKEGKYTDYVYLNGKHFAKIVNGEYYYYLTDHLGTTTMLLDYQGNTVWSEELGAFGEVVGKEEFNQEYAKYTGKDYDEVSGLYYFNARWYDSELGRFITEDPIKDGLNWYVYCNNNPLIFVDPSGLAIIISPSTSNTSFQKDTLTYLQALTRDTLAMKSDGTVIITKADYSSTNLESGTMLIRELNRKFSVTGETIDKNDVTIQFSSGDCSEDVNNWNDGMTLKKGSGSTVKFDDSINFKKLLAGVTDGTHKTSIQTALAHELIHSFYDKLGKTEPTGTGATPGYEEQAVGLGSHSTNPITENTIRNEQLDDKRIIY